MMNKKPSTLLTQEKMRELIAASQAGDKLARQQMIEGNTRLVWSIVQRFSSTRSRFGGFVSNWMYRFDEISRQV